MVLKACAHCGGLPELTFLWPVYGCGGCKIKCLSCGAEVRNARYTINKFDAQTRTLHTPVTLYSMLTCINSTVRRWNKGGI